MAPWCALTSSRSSIELKKKSPEFVVEVREKGKLKQVVKANFAQHFKNNVITKRFKSASLFISASWKDERLCSLSDDTGSFLATSSHVLISSFGGNLLHGRG